MKRRSLTGLVFASIVGVVGLGAGCNDEPLKQATPDEAARRRAPAEQAARVVAKVGDRTITLGDYARALERMDSDDRLAVPEQGAAARAPGGDD